MITLSVALCIALTSSGKAESLAQALHDANATYYAIAPYPYSSPAFDLYDAIAAYRRVLHIFGPVAAANAGLGRCLRREGSYSEAVEQLKLAGPRYAKELLEANRLAKLADGLSRRLGNKKFIQIARIPNSNLIVVLAGRPADMDGWHGEGCDRLTLVVARIRPAGIVVFDRRSLRLPYTGGAKLYAEDDEAGSTHLYLMHPTAKTGAWSAVIYRNFPAADCAPCSMTVAEITRATIRNIDAFGSLSTSRVIPPSGTHGLEVIASPTFKVWWPDTYEWRNGCFIFANSLHPENYSQEDYGWPDTESDAYYPEWMTRAAIYDIKRMFVPALKAWKRAEIACLNTIRYRYNRLSVYHDSGFYGEAPVNLLEIRQRIKWIHEKQFGHRLLYRPYDFDLQVPPYRLGEARGVQE